MFFRNVGLSPKYMALEPRRQWSSRYIMGFLLMQSCDIVDGHQRTQECTVSISIYTLKTEAVTSVCTYHTTQRHNPKNHNVKLPFPLLKF
jgi:hypothetical protein